MSQEKSIIELVGLGAMMSWAFIDENQWKLLQTNSQERDELLMQLKDKSGHDNVFSGCHFTEAQLFINGELVCETFTDITDQYAVTSHPVERLIELSDQLFCFVQEEVQRGVWGRAEVDGDIDHSKLRFHVHQTDLPRGHDTISAEYDGEELEFGGTDTKSGDWYVLDREGGKVSAVQTWDEQEQEPDQPAAVADVPLIKPFGLGEPEYERNEAIAKAQALIDEFKLSSDEVFENVLGMVANNSATIAPAIQQPV
jgi:hypothetical protein